MQPLQLICGSWPFRSLSLCMQRGVLIPRFETEYMVSLLIEELTLQCRGSKVRILEMGCGTGAIGLSLALELNEKFDVHVTMLDIDPLAVKISEENVKRNRLERMNINIVQDDMKNWFHRFSEFDLIVSNPPYLTETEYFNLHPQVKLYENSIALLGGKDGLLFVNQIIQAYCINKKQRSILMLEYGGQQILYLKQQKEIEGQLLKDQYGRQRFILLKDKRKKQ